MSFPWCRISCLGKSSISLQTLQLTFGCYNMLGFRDFYQIPPISRSDSLAIPPFERKAERAHRALELMWGEYDVSINYFVQFTVQKRIDDPRYANMMEEYRF